MGSLVALLFEHVPHTVTIFSRNTEIQGWTPMGEVHVPPGARASAALAIEGDELLITSREGEVHRRHLRHGTLASHRAHSTDPSRQFHASCASGKDRLTHLTLRQSS